MLNKILIENPIKNLILKWRIISLLNSLNNRQHIMNDMSKVGCISYLKHTCRLDLKNPDVLDIIKTHFPEIFKKIIS